MTVQVDWPKRQVIKEAVPTKRLQAVQLVAYRGEAFGQRDQVRHEHRLQLDIGLETNAFQQVGQHVLVRVVGEPPPKEL